jgi:hypothetical protein
MRMGKFVSADPDGRYLVVQAVETTTSHLFRVPLNGGNEQEITLDGPNSLKFGGSPIRNGRMLVSLMSPEVYYNPAGMIDLDTGHVTRWKLDYSGNFTRLEWTSDGQITGVATIEKSALWKFQPKTGRK